MVLISNIRLSLDKHKSGHSVLPPDRHERAGYLKSVKTSVRDHEQATRAPLPFPAQPTTSFLVPHKADKNMTHSQTDLTTHGTEE